jgi:hypothetical protein
VLFDWEVNDDLINVGNQVLEWATGCLASKTFPREDYRELVQLTVLFLGGTVPDFRFRKPGSLLSLFQRKRSNPSYSLLVF